MLPMHKCYIVRLPHQHHRGGPVLELARKAARSPLHENEQ